MKIFFSGVDFFKRNLIAKTLKFASKYLNQPKNCEVSCIFVGEDEIRQLNNQHRNKDLATDVLSFPNLNLKAQEIINDTFTADKNPQTQNFILGDIVICLDIAKKQAEEYGHSLKREIAFLALHALLHLLGYDHMEKTEEEKMFSLTENILEILNIKR